MLYPFSQIGGTRALKKRKQWSSQKGHAGSATYFNRLISFSFSPFSLSLSPPPLHLHILHENLTLYEQYR